MTIEINLQDMLLVMAALRWAEVDTYAGYPEEQARLASLQANLKIQIKQWAKGV